MSEPLAQPHGVSAWLESTLPEHPYRSSGVSGAALLYELLRRERRSTFILPAFTSYTLSGAATAAGKRVLHIDADPATLQMRTDFLDEAITAAGAEDVIVLIDHTCGHPFPGIAALRQRHPGVMIVEDCVRALGGEAGGSPLGSQGDWTLLSLYKTTPGNLNGAILLSRTPLDLPVEEPQPIVLKQRVAGIRAVRRLHQRLKRGPFSEPNRERGTLIWSPKRGSPNALCLRRFEQWLQYLPQRVEAQRSAAARIKGTLGELPGVTWIEEPPDSATAAHYLSFTVSPGLARNKLLAEMHRRGCALERTWHVVPSFYRGFAETFPFGSAGSEYLADHIVHIPVADYLDARSRERLLAALSGSCAQSEARGHFRRVKAAALPHSDLSASDAVAAQSRQLQVGWITSVESLRERASEWDDLWERSCVDSPAARAEPTALWLEHFASGRRLRCLTVEREGRLDAALPLYQDRLARILPTLRLPRNGWAASGDLLVDADAPEGVYDCLARELSRLSSGLLWLTLTSYESPRWLRLRAAMTRAGMPLLVEKQYEIPLVELGSDWETYDRSRDGDARRSRNRYARMMERDGGATLEVHSRFEPGELERLLRLGFEIEDRSWKGEEGSSVLKRPGLFEFTLRQARCYAESGALRLIFLKLAGEPIAFSYQYRSRGTQFCEKLGFDQQFRKYGPGRQMIMRLLQDLHADPECGTLDFAGRLMDWNAEWATGTYPVGRIIAAPRGIVGRSLLRAYRLLRRSDSD